MKLSFIKPVHAHCDLPCGVYDPVQARVEAQSVHEIMKKYAGLEHEEDKWRAVFIKEQRAELVKHHLWVLWTDYFKPEHVEKIFDPFFTTKGQGEGSGLGLTVARRIIRKFGGDIRLESVEGAGTSCMITLPLMAPASSSKEASWTASESRTLPLVSRS